MNCLLRRWGRPTRVSRRPRVILFPFAFLLALAVTGVVPSEAAPVWYSSNADFMDLERIDTGPGEGWFLAVRPAEDAEAGDEGTSREIRTLYLDGDVQGWEEIEYSSRGYPLRIIRFAPDEVGTRQELSRVEVRYRPDGTVRSVRRCRGDDCVLIRYAPPGMAGSELIEGPDMLMEIRYGITARPEYVRREEPGQPLEEKWFHYDQGRLVSSRTLVGTEETIRRYTEGHITLLETRRQGRLIERREYERASDGTLLLERRDLRNQTETERFFPGVTDGVVRELRVNGVLQEQEEVFPDGDRVVTRLRAGEILFRTWYSANGPVRREIFLDGEVVRVDRIEE